MQPAYQVKLDSFEGPLDLLLHLIKQYEIDIYDIPVAQITKQYMHYIHTMQQLELNIASEYLVMASTLIALKSQMLLPKQDLDEETDDYMEDPREELMQRLIEYRKYKEAAEELKKREVESHQIYTRPPVIFEDLRKEQPPVNNDVSIYDMLGALHKMMERKQWDQPLDTTIKRAEIPIEERMEEIVTIVKRSSNGIVFDQLFPHYSKQHIVVTFMALLELMKHNTVYCKQEKSFDLLYIYYMEETKWKYQS
ncbi:segregation/condensation protein A [Oceanobacillus halotolerans]|uniref:segregation/condensation protein A n=1 Tax=Oceanobacillus halotolerans TaxID=2663380 RepID=UPI0013DC27C3|nr:segregation/condensation protein A [Oceanobacillus halotolerans]